MFNNRSGMESPVGARRDHSALDRRLAPRAVSSPPWDVDLPREDLGVEGPEGVVVAR